MSALTTGFVVAGIVAALALGLARGLDVVSGVILVGVVGLGALAIAVARKSGAGAVAPARCTECDGVISPHAPYCKHCGATAGGSRA